MPAAAFKPAATAKSAGGIVSVVEYYNAGLKHYFITADLNEIAILDSGAFGGVWKRTGQEFPAWDLVGAPADTVPVCRFFGTDKYRADGTRIGPNSHFYDAVPDECEYVKTAWQSIAADGLSYPAWTFEKYAFAVKLRLSPQLRGLCPAGTQNLYRAYNNGLGGDPNHRYSTDSNLLGNMGGWATEGLVMCLPTVQGTGLPSQLIACYGTDCPDDAMLNNGPDLVNLVVDITNPTGTPIELFVAAFPAAFPSSACRSQSHRGPRARSCCACSACNICAPLRRRARSMRRARSPAMRRCSIWSRLRMESSTAAWIP